MEEKMEPYTITINDSFKESELEEFQGFVFVFDVLGTSQKNNEQLKDLLKFFNGELLAIIKAHSQMHKNQNNDDYLDRISIFQDTIILVFNPKKNDDKGTLENALFSIIWFVQSLFVFCFYKQIAIRGGLNYGNLVVYENSILGKPIVELKKYYDSFTFLGIYISDDLADLIKNNEILKKYSYKNIVVKCNVEFNNNNIPEEKYFLNWLPALCMTKDVIPDNFKSISDYFQYYLNQFQYPDLESIRKKYSITEFFFKSCLDMDPMLNHDFLFNQDKINKQKQTDDEIQIVEGE